MRRRVVVLTFLAYFGATAQQAAVAVPYVGCKSDVWRAIGSTYR